MAVVETTIFPEVVFLHVGGIVLSVEVMSLQVIGSVMFTEIRFST